MTKVEPHYYIPDPTYGMGDCAVCGIVSGDEIHHWNMDGHLLAIVALEEEGRPRFELVCAEPGRCTAKWGEQDGSDDPLPDDEFRALVKKWPCWLRYQWNADNSYMLETITSRAEGSGPYRIFWQWDGDGVLLYLAGDAAQARVLDR